MVCSWLSSRKISLTHFFLMYKQNSPEYLETFSSQSDSSPRQAPISTIAYLAKASTFLSFNSCENRDSSHTQNYCVVSICTSIICEAFLKVIYKTEFTQPEKKCIFALGKNLQLSIGSQVLYVSMYPNLTLKIRIILIPFSFLFFVLPRLLFILFRFHEGKLWYHSLYCQIFEMHFFKSSFVFVNAFLI